MVLMVISYNEKNYYFTDKKVQNVKNAKARGSTETSVRINILAFCTTQI